MNEQHNPAYAGFWRRAAAYFIDSFILTVIISLVFAPILFIAKMPESWHIVTNSSIFLVLLLYYTIMESSSKQASLGKIAVGIKVTDMHNNRISFWKAGLRSLGKIASATLLYAGFMMAGWTKRKQALHDMMAKCLVVNNEERSASQLTSKYTMSSYILASAFFILLAGYFYYGYFAEPLVPALRSKWIHVHVPLGLAAYSAAFASFIIAVIATAKRTPFPKAVVYLQLLVPMAFFLSMFSGALWANGTWGSYWSWDPKETWSLILLMAVMVPAFFAVKYAIFDWVRVSMLSIQSAAIVFVIMIDRILSGLHSYRMLF